MKILFLLLISTYLFSCKFHQDLFQDVIRFNHFDSSNYVFGQVDTNKVNAQLYKGVIGKVGFNSSIKCLLLKVSLTHAVKEEFGLYDYRTKKFFYCSSESRDLYNFKEVSKIENVDIFQRMLPLIDNPNASLEYMKEDKLNDGSDFDLNLITADAENNLIVNTYHW